MFWFNNNLSLINCWSEKRAVIKQFRNCDSIYLPPAVVQLPYPRIDGKGDSSMLSNASRTDNLTGRHESPGPSQKKR